MRWKKIVGWTLAALGILVVVGMVGGLLFLRTASFQRMAIRNIVREADAATGGHAEIGGLDFRLSTLTARLYNITLHGNEASGEPPLLHADKLTVGVKIKSILHHQVTLSELEIENPVAHVRVDRNGGSNLPQSPASQSSGNTSVFDLAAGHVLVTGGAIQYNDKKIPLDAELYDFKTEVHFEPANTGYHGTLSYDKGQVRYRDEPSLAHALRARFSATPTQFALESADLKVGSSDVSLNAALSNYSNPSVDGHYSVTLDARDFSGFTPTTETTGAVTSSGVIHYQAVEGQPVLRGLLIDGQIASDELAAATSQGRFAVRDLQGHYRLADGNLQARDISFGTLDGGCVADLNLQHLDTTTAGHANAKLRGISLQAAQHALRQAQFNHVILTGALDGTVDAAWTGTVADAQIRTDLLVKAPSSSGQLISSQKVPVNGGIHALYDGHRNTITFHDTSLRIPSAAVGLQGQVSSHSNLQLQINAGDLHGLAEMLSALGSQQATSLEIAGSATVKAVLQGSMQRPQVDGQVNAQNLKIQGSEWKTVQASIQANPSQVSLRDGLLVSAQQGRASLNGSVALRDWKYSPSSAITANLSVQHMAIVNLQRLAHVNYPVSGDLTADISLRGTQLKPAGNGSARIDHAEAFKEPIQHVAAKFSGDQNSLTSTFDVSLLAGTATGTISFTPKTKAYTVKLNAPGIVLQKLQMVEAKNVGIAGTVTLSASGQGTLDDPQLEASIELPQLLLRDKSISQMKGQLHVANHRAEIALDSQMAQATLHSHANVSLSGDYDTDASIDTSGIPLEALLATFEPSPPKDFKGTTELHATLKGPLKDFSRIEAHVTIPTLKASYQSLEIGAAGPIRVDYANSLITLQPAEIRGTDTSLRVQGTLPLKGGSSPSLSAQGSIDVRILKILSPDVESSGTISLDVHASGKLSDAAVQGQLRFQDVAISTPTAPLSVQKLNGTLAIADNTLHLSGLTGEVGGGRVEAGGSISYRPDLQFNVSLQSKSVRLRYPDGVRALLDANLVLSGNKDASVLNGRVLIDNLSFTPDFDLSKFSDQFGGATVPSAPGLADNIKLAIGVQSKSNLSATSSQVTVEGDVNLQVVGTAANPVIVGRTDLTSGELFYRNVRYQLQRGIITFDNPAETNPTLNISATTTIEQYNLTITLRGPIDKLTTSYTSDPPLATADVISLIANGQTTSEASAAGTSTDSILASQVAGQVTGGIQHLAGISALQIDPLLGGNNQNPSARVAIQQRVSKNFFFTFSTDLSQPGSEVVQGDYQLNQHWSVSVTRDEVGGVSVDGKYHTRF